MTLRLTENQSEIPENWQSILTDNVRSEFQVDTYIPKKDDKILFGQPCLVKNCAGAVKGHGLCQSHLAIWTRRGRPDIEQWFITENIHEKRHLHDVVCCKCSVDGCGRSAAVRGYCSHHNRVVRGRERRSKGDQIDVSHFKPSNKTDISTVCIFPSCTFPCMPPNIKGNIRQFCDHHELNYSIVLKRTPSLTPEKYVASRIASWMPKFSFNGLHVCLKLELQYALQTRHDQKLARWRSDSHTALISTIIRSKVKSILDWSAGDWSKFCDQGSDVLSFIRFALHSLIILRDTSINRTVYDRDVWYLTELGYRDDEPAPVRHFVFTNIEPLWFRNLVKCWIRSRINHGRRANTIHSNISHMITFTKILCENRISLEKPSDLSRGILLHYLELLRLTGWSGDYRGSLIGSLQLLLEANMAHEWENTIPSTTRYFNEEIPKRGSKIPRFISEFLMNQLENDINIALFPSLTEQALYRLMVTTGLRGVDLTRLTIDCVIHDKDGNPLLRYTNYKFSREAVTIIDQRSEQVISDQRERVLRDYGNIRWLFPRPQENHEGRFNYSTGTWRQQLQAWLSRIDLRDENGRKVTVTPHQFRHTYATRLVNSGVPLDCISILLDHSSTSMSERYAEISFKTIRREWEKAKMVDVFGNLSSIVGEGSTSDTAWALHNLSRVKQTLPNGYCARPLQQQCPHPNACLICPDFRTTNEFLPYHKKQFTQTLKLVERARHEGHARIVEMNQPTLDNLQKIINSLEKDEANVS